MRSSSLSEGNGFEAGLSGHFRESVGKKMNHVGEPTGEGFLTVVSTSEMSCCFWAVELGSYSLPRGLSGCWTRFCTDSSLGMLSLRLSSQELGSLWPWSSLWAGRWTPSGQHPSMGLFSQPVGFSSQHPRRGHRSGSADPPVLLSPHFPFGPLRFPGPWYLACWLVPLRKGFSARRHAQVSTCLSVLCQAVEIFIFMLTRKKGIYQSPRCGNQEIGCWGQGMLSGSRIPPHPPLPLLVGCCPGGRPPFIPPTITQAGRGHHSHAPPPVLRCGNC